MKNIQIYPISADFCIITLWKCFLNVACMHVCVTTFLWSEVNTLGIQADSAVGKQTILYTIIKPLRMLLCRSELYFVKLPNFLSIETRPFDPTLYEDEADEDHVQDEEGHARTKLKV